MAQTAAAQPRQAWSVNEVAASYGLSRGTVLGLIRDGQLVSKRVGRRVLVLDSSVRAWFASLR